MLALAGLKNQLEACLRTFKRYLHDGEAKACLANYLVILVSSFLQEWERLERLGSSPSVRHTLVSASPATKRIRTWRGLHRVRSTMLAHGFRGKDGRLANTSALFGPGQVPTTFAGQMLLGELAVYAIATAICHHGGHGDRGLAKLATTWPDEEPQASGISTMGEFHAEIAAVRREIFASDPSLEAAFGSYEGGT